LSEPYGAAPFLGPFFCEIRLFSFADILPSNIVKSGVRRRLDTMAIGAGDGIRSRDPQISYSEDYESHPLELARF